MRSLLTPWLVIPAVLAAMGLTMWTAVRLDCDRLAEEYFNQADVVDDGLIAQESAWMAYVGIFPQRPAEIDEVVDKYSATKDRPERRSIFRRATRRFHEASTPERRAEWGREAANTRGLFDTLAGIANRWEITEQDYLKRVAELKAFNDSWRGKIARSRGSQSNRHDTTPDG